MYQLLFDEAAHQSFSGGVVGGGLIGDFAAKHVQSHYADTPDPDRLLGDEFTMLELRLAHEAIAGRPLQRDRFRRTMEPQLVPTGEMAAGTRGRPAELFRRRP